METSMEKLPKSNYRFEKKFNLDTKYLTNFLIELNNNGFYEIYEKRTINNIYYDDSYSNFNDNVEGVSKRVKPRIRWYGPLFGSSNKTLEFKKKSGHVGTKNYIKIGEIKFETLSDILENSTLDSLFNNQSDYNTFYKYEISLINSYNRVYFENKLLNIRITIDRDIKYIDPKSEILLNDNPIVVEIKYDIDTDFKNIFNFLVLSKNSKYVRGVTSFRSTHKIY